MIMSSHTASHTFDVNISIGVVNDNGIEEGIGVGAGWGYTYCLASKVEADVWSAEV